MDIKLKEYKNFTNPIINNIIRNFYITNGDKLAHSSFDILFNPQTLTNEQWNKVGALANITDQQITEIENEIKAVDNYNTSVQAYNNDLIKLAKDILFQLNNANLIKYLNKEANTERPDYTWWHYNPCNQNIKELVKAAKQRIAWRENVKKQEEASKNIINEAIKYCFDNNKKIGEDFTVDNCIDIANEIAYEKAKQELMQNNEYIDFNGQNCDGPCKGWDMIERRCECGNRRVSFCCEGGFKRPIVYGEAY